MKPPSFCPREVKSNACGNKRSLSPGVTHVCSHLTSRKGVSEVAYFSSSILRLSVEGLFLSSLSVSSPARSPSFPFFSCGQKGTLKLIAQDAGRRERGTRGNRKKNPFNFPFEVFLERKRRRRVKACVGRKRKIFGLNLYARKDPSLGRLLLPTSLLSFLLSLVLWVHSPASCV